MVLGFLVAGMGLGAVAAAAWLLAGGSILFALVLYSLVATACILGAALLTFRLSERKTSETCATAETLRPAE